jgi:hypothetical protein
MSKARIGLTFNSDRLPGKVVESWWQVHTDYDGTEYKLQTRLRVGYTTTGKLFRKTDFILIIGSLGWDYYNMVSAHVLEHGTHLMETNVGWVCLSCLTSDCIRYSEKTGIRECTRCGAAK